MTTFQLAPTSTVEGSAREMGGSSLQEPVGHEPTPMEGRSALEHSAVQQRHLHPQ